MDTGEQSSCTLGVEIRAGGTVGLHSRSFLPARYPRCVFTARSGVNDTLTLMGLPPPSRSKSNDPL